VSGGLARRGLAYARAIDAEAVQVFVTNPRGWAPTPGDDDQDAAFRRATDDGLPAFVHASYLVNLGSPDLAVVARSVQSLDHTLRRAEAIGARGVVVHTGSAVLADRYDQAMRSTREALLPLLDLGDRLGVSMLLEPMAGQGRSLCSTLEEIEEYLRVVGLHPALALCLDTCHAYAAGHDLAARGGMTRFLDRLAGVSGGAPLLLVHANDSMDALGAGTDRHQRVGLGKIGAAPFRTLLRHPTVRRAAVVIETPGDQADHREDVAKLRRLRGR